MQEAGGRGGKAGDYSHLGKLTLLLHCGRTPPLL
jgi:hypothetical protein